MPSEIRDIILYSVPELSKKLNVTTVTVRKYLKQGKLKGKKVMGRWFISGEEVTEFFTNTPTISYKRSYK